MLRRNPPPHLSDNSLLHSSLSAPTQHPSVQKQQVMGSSSSAWPEPTSPGALSSTSFMSTFSWVAEKSSQELTTLLKNAYSSLRDRERDLALAAEIGKSLLENNQLLKAKYEGLLDQVRATSRHTPSPDDEYGLLKTPTSDRHSDEQEDDEEGMRLISKQRAREAMIEALERKNREMQTALDRALTESDTTRRNHIRQTELLQRDIDSLRAHLDSAASKIQELEQKREHHAQEYHSPNKERTVRNYVPQLEEQDFQRLSGQLAKLESDHAQLAAAKEAIETKLASALADMDQLRQQYEHLQFTQEGHAALQAAYQRQFKHIEELTTSLEEHRVILGRLRDRGVCWSPISSECGMRSPRRSYFGESALQSPRQAQRSLMGELENAWKKQEQVVHSDISCSLTRMREVATQLTEHSMIAFSGPPGSAKGAWTGLSSTVTEQTPSSNKNRGKRPVHLAPSASAPTHSNAFEAMETEIPSIQCTEERDAWNDLFGPQSSSVYAVKDLYPSLHGLSADDIDFVRLRHKRYQSTAGALAATQGDMSLFQGVFYAVWRWSRFTIVLTTALMINLWQGPEAIMEK
ncbi:hypothetical protein BCR43DRAFT_485546 [Syncephalastrum racemosum]|uniref:Uncharacterized protein n=1 Tax=Syncephalastrum racemosum TaxID=13706 RepID=A0A1X2HMK1_SYNRA|nr:hypothetical protein BCR43DRAFT_485546 [Syncephalastrum racemosum]